MQDKLLRAIRKAIGKDADMRLAIESTGAYSLLRVAEALKTVRGVGPITATTISVLVPELGTLGRRRAAALAELAPLLFQPPLRRSCRQDRQDS